MCPKKRSPRNAKSKRGRGELNVPVDLGEEYEIDITEMSPNGEGIGRVRGYSIFTANAKVGEHVRVKIKAINQICADAELVK